MFGQAKINTAPAEIQTACLRARCSHFAHRGRRLAVLPFCVQREYRERERVGSTGHPSRHCGEGRNLEAENSRFLDPDFRRDDDYAFTDSLPGRFNASRIHTT